MTDLHIRLKALVATVTWFTSTQQRRIWRSGGYRWHAIPPVARNLVTNPLRRCLSAQIGSVNKDRDAMPAKSRPSLSPVYRHFAEISSNGGTDYDPCSRTDDALPSIFRHKRLNSNSILRPITVASAEQFWMPIPDYLTAAKASCKRSKAVCAVHGARANDKADGRLPKGSDWESREAAMHAFSEYFAGTIFFDILRGDRAALRGKQLNLLKDACEVIYRDENRKEWKQSTEKIRHVNRSKLVPRKLFPPSQPATMHILSWYVKRPRMLFQTDGELNTVRVTKGLQNRDLMTRLTMFKRKRTTPERLTGRELLRYDFLSDQYEGDKDGKDSQGV